MGSEDPCWTTRGKLGAVGCVEEAEIVLGLGVVVLENKEALRRPRTTKVRTALC